MVSAATIETDVYEVMETLLLAHKPTYTRKEIDYTYTLLAEYPKRNPIFPIMILNSAIIPTEFIDLKNSTTDYMISVQIDFYAKEAHGAKAIDEAIQSLRATIIGNESTFTDTDGLILTEDFWDSSNVVPFEDRNQLLHTGSVIVKFKLK